MKKIFIIYFLIFFCFLNQANSKISSYSRGQEVSGFIQLSNKTKFNLPNGKWEVFDRYVDSGYGMQWNLISLGRIENNELIEILEIGYANLAGAFVKYVDHGLNEIMFKDKYDGCYERPEYYLLELFKKGVTHNCFRIRHFDVFKELNNPDDITAKGYLAPLKQYLRSNSDVTIPKVGLSSFHSYFSRTAGGNWFIVQYLINPKYLNGPENNFFTEETSEYHKQNINRFSDHKKTMEKWISISAKRHKEIEIISNSKSHHKLQLDKYIFADSLELQSDELVDQIKKLNELYKSGVLSKKEFEKAKSKILNQ